MIKFYENKKKDINPPYTVFQAFDADTTITLYESGKVVFQGLSADIEASLWTDLEKKLNNKQIKLEDKSTSEKKNVETKYPYLKKISTAGSDEVGTGDYFGPIVVTASYVDQSKIGLMQDLGVDDSKKLTDEKIKQIAPTLIKEIPHITMEMKNNEYNELKDHNMNKIKAILHNKVLVKLLENEELKPEKIVIDQFVYPKKYFEHISSSPKKVTNIFFLTKAESQVYSVAVSSIISRYVFLTEMNKMSENLHKSIPLGAGSNVDEFGKNLVKELGPEILKNYAKLNFKNTDKILNH